MNVLGELLNGLGDVIIKSQTRSTVPPPTPKPSSAEHSRKMIELLRGALDLLVGDECEFLTPICLDYARLHPVDFEKAIRASYGELIDGDIEDCL